jgi:NAD+ diphosphatase
MIQDIEPHIFDNEYKPLMPKQEDYMMIFREDALLTKQQGEEIEFPTLTDLQEMGAKMEKRSIFLFSIDQINYFLVRTSQIEESDTWKYEKVLLLKEVKPMWKVFAATVAGQLNRWYATHQFCGKCGTKLVLSETERALKCPSCGLVIYPTISPSVIVAVTKGDQILLTKYATGAYRRYALVAGYTEVGETLEQTVAREVLEEVGLKVKNITYYKTQPWAFTDTLLIGYFAEVDGDDTVTLQESELSEGTWFHRDEIPATSTDISLTNEMIEVFRNNNESEIYHSVNKSLNTVNLQ